MSYVGDGLDVLRDRQWRSFYAAEGQREGREDPVFYMQEPPSIECHQCHGELGWAEDCDNCQRWARGAA